MDPFLGQIMLFAGNFAVRGFALCDGQLLPINQNQALFSLLGTQYGGNGITNFALPDLRGRLPVHQGQGPGLTDRVMGETGGTESITLASGELPAHAHPLVAQGGHATSGVPAANAGYSRAVSMMPYHAVTANVAVMAGAALSSTGGGQAHGNLMPFLGLNYQIALEGIFPSRN
jgi:microcystin-dependent protein